MALNSKIVKVDGVPCLFTKHARHDMDTMYNYGIHNLNKKQYEKLYFELCTLYKDVKHASYNMFTNKYEGYLSCKHPIVA